MVFNLMLAASPIPGGGYVSLVKIVVAMVVLFVWARLLTWADADAIVAHMPRMQMNMINMGGFVVAFAAFFLVPSFWIGLPILLAVAAGEAFYYIQLRDRIVGLNDLRRQWKGYKEGFKGKKKETVVAEVVFTPKATGKPLVPPDDNSPDRPPFDAAQLALGDPLKKAADQVDIDGRTGAAITMKYIVDGVAYAGKSVDGASAAQTIEFLKGLAGMDIADRRKPQTGTLKINFNGKKAELKLQTAGSTAGEYMRIQVDAKNRHHFGLEDLGLSPDQLAKVKESIKENTGVVLLTTPKGMGLTSLCYGVLRGHDAFLKHLQTIERDPEEDIEGITQNKLPNNAPAGEEFKQVDWVISQEPDAIFINKIEDPRSAAALIEYARHGKRVYVALRATSTFDALTQWRKMIGDDNLAVETLAMVVNGRVIRKLCNNCKVPYAPDAPTLKKLGMNPEKVTQLFQARSSPIRDQKGNVVPCEFCHDLRWKGRTGVFELMTVDEEIKQAVMANKPIEPVFRKQRSKFLQEEALAMVEQGDTSVQEVKRILRPDAADLAARPQGDSAADAPPASPQTPASAAPPRRPPASPARKS
jgi:type II secretory ATPase GspE/PulE/Tfp pilus assembly ATPase PilB-like protein